MLAELEMPFFRVPGNHDIANKVAQELWRERHGATYYHFVYKDVLFLVLDSNSHNGLPNRTSATLALLLATNVSLVHLDNS